MNSGAPTFGTPEASRISYMVQVNWRVAWDCRSGRAVDCAVQNCLMRRRPMKHANTLNAALMGGVNFMLHACGWLEGGSGVILRKICDGRGSIGVLHHLAKGVSVDENAQAMDAIREVGPGGHYLGCAHTQANFKEAFWRTSVLDYKPFETWDEEGARDTYTLAAARVKTMLETYQKPAMDPAVNEALHAYVAQKKASMPDSFT
jgi:trimethylamine--corrinoid protein Co-methyltransferase